VKDVSGSLAINPKPARNVAYDSLVGEVVEVGAGVDDASASGME
jgi:hypothetical protein